MHKNNKAYLRYNNSYFNQKLVTDENVIKINFGLTWHFNAPNSL